MGNELKPPYADSFGYSLAMRVMQSDLYRRLDGRERAECDELIRRGQSASAPVGEPVAYIAAGDMGALKYGGHPIAGAKTAPDDIPLYASPLPLLAKCAQIAEWHLQDNDECGVLAREVYEAISKASASPLPQEPREAEQVCAEAYQVVGSLLSDLGKFDTDEAEKILDNLSQAKMVHKDVLPWPSYEPREAELTEENRRLRQLLCDVLKALGNGSGASPECSMEFLSYIPEEVRLVVADLRGAQEGKAGWVMVPRIGTTVSADHPQTCLNPTPTFEVMEVRADRSGSGFAVRGENTCWFGTSMIRPSTTESADSRDPQ